MRKMVSTISVGVGVATLAPRQPAIATSMPSPAMNRPAYRARGRTKGVQLVTRVSFLSSSKVSRGQSPWFQGFKGSDPLKSFEFLKQTGLHVEAMLLTLGVSKADGPT